MYNMAATYLQVQLSGLTLSNDVYKDAVTVIVSLISSEFYPLHLITFIPVPLIN